MTVVEALVIVVWLGSSFWVAMDNEVMGRRYGRSNAAPSKLWFIGCVLLWIVVFPFYLVHRSRRRRAGLQEPPMPTGTPVVAGPPEWIPNPKDPRFVVY